MLDAAVNHGCQYDYGLRLQMFVCTPLRFMNVRFWVYCGVFILKVSNTSPSHFSPQGQYGNYQQWEMVTAPPHSPALISVWALTSGQRLSRLKWWLQLPETLSDTNTRCIFILWALVLAYKMSPFFLIAQCPSPWLIIFTQSVSKAAMP